MALRATAKSRRALCQALGNTNIQKGSKMKYFAIVLICIIFGSCSFRSPHKLVIIDPDFAAKKFNQKNTFIYITNNTEVNGYQAEFEVYFQNDTDKMIDTLNFYLDKSGRKIYQRIFEIHSGDKSIKDSIILFEELNEIYSNNSKRYVLLIEKIAISNSRITHISSGYSSSQDRCKFTNFVSLYDLATNQKLFKGEISGFSSSYRSYYVQAIRDAIYFSTGELIYGLKINFKP